ncbi:MAG: helix-turn-helix domain-containing protein [Desulfovibrio sp.]|jgi:transcriptional regulator with XRE-family HTH domain|nr:helix-turn-helix domain-containing protein [Desulfovibrio sp.]
MIFKQNIAYKQYSIAPNSYKNLYMGMESAYMQETIRLVGERIREARKRKGLTQEEVAELAAMDATYYGRVERGEANVSLALLTAIASAVGVSLVKLVDVGVDKSHAQMVTELVSAVQSLPEAEIRRLYHVYPLLFPPCDVMFPSRTG